MTIKELRELIAISPEGADVVFTMVVQQDETGLVIDVVPIEIFTSMADNEGLYIEFLRPLY